MEYGLGQNNRLAESNVVPVLILVLMEYGLGQIGDEITLDLTRLNPCFNGIWSRTNKGGDDEVSCGES